VTRALLLALVVACDQASSVGRFVRDGAEEAAAAHGELLCKINASKCGHVYACDATADNDLGQVEICVQNDTPIEDVEAQYGACEPTPRHTGLCYWHCDGGAGCNALSGCWCP